MPDASVPFPIPSAQSGCVASWYTPSWSSETSGDLDVRGNLTIAGDDAQTTVIDAKGIDRAIKVYPNANLVLQGKPSNGRRGPGGRQGGARIAERRVPFGLTPSSWMVIRPSTAFMRTGGGIAIWDGGTWITRSTISENKAQGEVVAFSSATGPISPSPRARSRLTRHQTWSGLRQGPCPDFATSPNGAGVLSVLGGPMSISNTTISGNRIFHNVGNENPRQREFYLGNIPRRRAMAIRPKSRLFWIVSRWLITTAFLAQRPYRDRSRSTTPCFPPIRMTVERWSWGAGVHRRDTTL